MTDQRPRLLHVIGSSKFGGAYEIIFALCDLAREQGIDPYVLTTDPEGQRHCRKRDIPVVDLAGIDRPIRPWKDLWVSLRLARFLRRNRFDLIHTHVSKGGVIGRFAARLARTSAGVIHTHHGLTVHEGNSRWYIAFFAAVERRVSKWCDLAILLTESDAAFNRRRKFIPESKTVVIANGIPDPMSDPAVGTSRSDVLRELGLSESPWYIGNFCRLSAVKNLGQWLRALAELSEVDGRPVHGLIAGDGEEREDLEELAESLGIADRVHFLGFRRDRLALMKACDIFLTTSRSEGMSISVLEAMGLGMGIVATDVRGNRDCLRDRQDGLLVPYLDPVATAAACRELLEDPALLGALEESARNRFEQSYGVEVMKANTWKHAYVPVLASHGVLVDGGG